MLDNLISDLYLHVFQYLNVKELNIFRCISKYLHQYCFFFSLIDWSLKTDWCLLKVLLPQQECIPEKIREQNIHNWYKILKYQRQESSWLDSPTFTWRQRSPEFQTRILERVYYHKKILRKITSRVSNGWELLTTDSPIELYCSRSIKTLSWNVYDQYNMILAKIKFSPILMKKEQLFHILRPNNKTWFNIKYNFNNGRPRRFQIYNFESNLWENSNNLESNLELFNNNNYDLGTTKKNITFYRLKYHHIRPNQASIKNCSISFENKCIYEFGKKNNYFLYGYQSPLHGLYAFVLSCCQILI